MGHDGPPGGGYHGQGTVVMVQVRRRESGILGREYLPDRILRRGVMGTIVEAERGLVACQVSNLHARPQCLSVLQLLATGDDGNGLMNTQPCGTGTGADLLFLWLSVLPLSLLLLALGSSGLTLTSTSLGDRPLCDSVGGRLLA